MDRFGLYLGNIFGNIFGKPIGSNMETWDGPSRPRDQPGSRTARVSVDAYTLLVVPLMESTMAKG